MCRLVFATEFKENLAKFSIFVNSVEDKIKIIDITHIFHQFEFVNISASNYILTYKRLFRILDLPKSELLFNFPLLGLSKNNFLVHRARLARSSWLKCQAGKLFGRQQRVLHLYGLIVWVKYKQGGS